MIQTSSTTVGQSHYLILNKTPLPESSRVPIIAHVRSHLSEVDEVRRLEGDENRLEEGGEGEVVGSKNIQVFEKFGISV